MERSSLPTTVKSDLERTQLRHNVAVATFLVTDHLGSITHQLDINGGLIEYREYSPYGEQVLQWSPSDSPANSSTTFPFGFMGKEMDETTGLLYCHHRYLDPDLGRWLSPDPIGTTGGLNLFRYAASDPINLSDHSGLNYPDASHIRHENGHTIIGPKGRNIYGTVLDIMKTSSKAQRNALRYSSQGYMSKLARYAHPYIQRDPMDNLSRFLRALPSLTQAILVLALL